MKKVFIAILIIPAFLTLNVKAVFAGSTQTDGQGSRPISLGGAFTAVADSPTAIYYNPAGLVQTKGVEAELSAFLIDPKNKYINASNGVTNSSGKLTLAPGIFMSCDALKPVVIGFGMYAPFARESDYGSDPAGGFTTSNALVMRVDYSVVGAFKVNEQLSLGGGFIMSEAKTNQTVQPIGYGSAVYVTDHLHGTGYGWLASALLKLTKYWNVGATYRSRMDIPEVGQRAQTGWSGEKNIKANIRYPDTLGIGITCKPDEKLTISADIDYNGWGYFKEVLTRVDGGPDTVTNVEAHDTVDYRAGIEYKPLKALGLRCGFMYIPGAVPSRNILPQKPDYHRTYAVTFGASTTLKNAEFILLYEYEWSDKWDVSDNAYGYNGRYEVRAQTFGFDVKFAF